MVFLLFTPQLVFAEIWITESSTMKNLIFDGKWTHKNEWKESSHKAISFDKNKILHLRTAHQDNHIYFLLDFISDTKIDTNMDRAVICLESNNKKSSFANSNNFCFMVIMNGKNTHVLQGGSINAVSGNFNKIYSNEFIGIGKSSDSNDRYSKKPHASYEFKIPLELVGRSSEYGMYISLYDYKSDELFSWPKAETKNHFSIPSPNTWGTLVSPDKSLS
jgi:hypothetical protein